MTTSHSLIHLSDEQLLTEVRKLSKDERRATAALIASLAEVDTRKLYLCEGCSSLFTYCTQVLRLSEHAAYGRIEAARAARRFPQILELLADGDLTLTSVSLLAPHLTPENHPEVLVAAKHRSKRDVEHLVATLRPQPPTPRTIRKLPTSQPAQSPAPRAETDGLFVDSTSLAGASQIETAMSSQPAGRRPAVIAPIAPEQYKLQVTVSADTHNKVRRAQDLMRHSVPNGDLATILDRALTLLVAELEKTKYAATSQPRTARPTTVRSRHIPSQVRRNVWERDGGQCAFIGTHGRCTERGFLEFHHLVPYAEGGTSVEDNLELRCRAHNAYEADRWFGPLLARERMSPVSSVQTESLTSSFAAEDSAFRGITSD